MFVFRLVRHKWVNDLTGKGAQLNGGRWNNKGVPCIYTGQNRSLCVLEYSVSTRLEDVPRALCMVLYEVPDEEIYSVPIYKLPGNWQSTPHPDATKDFGSSLLKGKRRPLAIALPSVIIPSELNFILNPIHPEFNKIRINNIEDFIYDVRLKV